MAVWRCANALSLVQVIVTSTSDALSSSSTADSASCDVLDEYFPGVPVIQYKGPTSTDPMSFRYYNKHEIILGKEMGEWLRFSVAFW